MRCVDDMTGLVVGTPHNVQTMISDVPVMFMVGMKSIGIQYAMIVNPVATQVVMTAQIHHWGYEAIARIDSDQSNSDPLHSSISVVNKSSQQLFSWLTLYIRLYQRLPAEVGF